jgi:4-hydroxy-tetrahydrodipicolinate synthase
MQELCYSLDSMRDFQVAGVIPAMLTPFDAAGALDLDLLREDVRMLIRTGVAALCVGGFPSETAGMAGSELQQVCQTVHSSTTLPLFVSIHPNSITEAIELARAAVDGGADVLLVAQPHYLFQPSLPGLAELFSGITNCVAIPVLLSNTLPAAPISLPVIRGLIEAGVIDGILQGAGDAHLLADLLSSGDRVPVLNGVEGLMYVGLLLGSKATVSIIAAVFPDACCRLESAFARGEHREALRLHEALLRSWRLLDHPVELPWRLKSACRLVGRDLGVPRSPFQVPSEHSAAMVHRAVEAGRAITSNSSGNTRPEYPRGRTL